MNRNRDRESVGTGLAHSDTAPAGPDPLTPERAPSIQSRLVRREALFERLSAAPANCVVLVCAPAGSGKTMLLRSWLDAAGLSEQTAWAAVEQGERDAQHFWLSVIDALAGTAAGSVERIGPTPGFRGEAVVERLLEDLRSVEEPLVLVIDDLHELQSPEALRWLELLVARRPANLSLMLTSRAEPQLNLHRLRLAAELTEIRASDLRFSPRRQAGCCGRARSSSQTRRWPCFTSGRRAGSRACGWQRSRSTGTRTRSDSCVTSPAASEASRDI